MKKLIKKAACLVLVSVMVFGAVLPGTSGVMKKFTTLISSADEYSQRCDHNFSYEVNPTCTNEGYSVCKKCYERYDFVDELGHVDNDNNLKCDRCGTKIAPVVSTVIYEPVTREIPYGHSIIIESKALRINDAEKMPSMIEYRWETDSKAVKIEPMGNGSKCKVTAVGNGGAAIYLVIYDANTGAKVPTENIPKISVKSQATIIQIITYFFKSLFGASTLIEDNGKHAVWFF